MEQIQISGKNIGKLALADACKRCFWLQLKLNFKTPYSIFPGIFSSIDSYTKKVIQGYYDTENSFPPWFSSLGDLTGYIEPPHHSKFFALDLDNNLKITGAPDGVYKKADGTLMIVDYKTARYTDGQDKLIPEYNVQLNTYAWIAESIGMGKVSELKLIYFEPQTEEVDAGMGFVIQPDAFLMKFKPTIVDIQVDQGVFRPLLKQVREIADLQKIPEIEGVCKNCEGVGRMIGLHNGDTNA